MSRLLVYLPSFVPAILAAVLLYASSQPAGAQSGGPGSIFTIAKVAVKAEARDAVEAKQLAISRGQQQAFRTLMRRLTGFSARSRLPQLDDNSVERLVSGMQVRSERNSGTVYLAQLDFNFRADAVKDTLNRFGIPYVTDRAPEVMLMPVYLEGGTIKPGDGNPWQEALAALDFNNTLTPMRLVPARTDLTPDKLRKIATNPAEVLDSLNYQHGPQSLVLAIADADLAKGMMKIRIVGRDGLGMLNIERRFKIYDQDVSDSADLAAAIALNMFEDRWKMGLLALQGGSDAPQELASVELTAQFAGLKEWRMVKDRLAKIPGVQSLDVKSVNPRGAAISLVYPGGVERLARTAAAYGLIIDGDVSGWVLRAQ